MLPADLKRLTVSAGRYDTNNFIKVKSLGASQFTGHVLNCRACLGVSIVKGLRMCAICILSQCTVRVGSAALPLLSTSHCLHCLRHLLTLCRCVNGLPYLCLR